ncbi:MAG: hypothetical protein K6G50_11050 [bacterium]|nr:hypothetical protein [bacterium]
MIMDKVEPVLLQYSEQVAQNLELAKELGNYYEEQKAALPFHINVIDVNVNEYLNHVLMTFDPLRKKLVIKGK